MNEELEYLRRMFGKHKTRIAELELAIQQALGAMSDSNYGDRAVTGKVRERLQKALHP